MKQNFIPTLPQLFLYLHSLFTPPNHQNPPKPSREKGKSIAVMSRKKSRFERQVSCQSNRLYEFSAILFPPWRGRWRSDIILTTVIYKESPIIFNNYWGEIVSFNEVLCWTEYERENWFVGLNTRALQIRENIMAQESLPKIIIIIIELIVFQCVIGIFLNAVQTCFVDIESQKIKCALTREIYSECLKIDYKNFDNPEFYKCYAWTIKEYGTKCRTQWLLL